MELNQTLDKSKQSHELIGVFWDIENMSPPSIVPASQTCTRIVEFASKLGIVHSINAYGDIQQFRKDVRTEIQHCGINFFDVPSGKKNAADTAILVDMLLFAIDHKPPATILLISGDSDFSNALSRLKQRGYTISLVCSNIKVARVLGHVCSSVFEWADVVGLKGQLNDSFKASDDSRNQENYRLLVDFLFNQKNFKASLKDVVNEFNGTKITGFDNIGDFLRSAQDNGIISCYELPNGEVKVRLRSHHIKSSFISLADLISVLKTFKKDLFTPLEGFIKSKLAKIFNIKKISPIEWSNLVDLAERAGFIITKQGNELIIYPPSGEFSTVDSREFKEDLIDENVYLELKNFLQEIKGESFSGKLSLAEFIQQKGPPSLNSTPLALICSMLCGIQSEGLITPHRKSLIVAKDQNTNEESPEAKNEEQKENE